MHRALSPWAATMLALAAGSGHAASCTVTAGPLAFGLYDTLLATASESTGQVTVSCTPGPTDPLTTHYTLTLAGTGTGGDPVRAVSAGAYRLHYQLYKDAARLQVWGNGGTSGSGVSSSVNSVAVQVPGVQMHTVYASMPGQQTVPAGVYSGSLLVTIDY